jgi:hypothetical protein
MVKKGGVACLWVSVVVCLVLCGGCFKFGKSGANHDAEVVAKYARLKKAMKKASGMKWLLSVDDVEAILEVSDISPKHKPGTWVYTYSPDSDKNSRKIVLDFEDLLLTHALLYDPEKSAK